jgi:hypothetical protein
MASSIQTGYAVETSPEAQARQATIMFEVRHARTTSLQAAVILSIAPILGAKLVALRQTFPNLPVIAVLDRSELLD